MGTIGVEALRSEVIESEKAQANLVKWKLILVAGLGSASLGLSGSATFANAQYLICLTPLVCAYVDLNYFHQTLRILVIGSFLRNVDVEVYPGIALLKSYEAFVEGTRERSEVSSFAFEEWAIQGSSIVFSLLVVLFGTVVAFVGKSADLKAFTIYFLSGFTGLLLSFFILKTFRHKQSLVNERGKGHGQ